MQKTIKRTVTFSRWVRNTGVLVLALLCGAIYFAQKDQANSAPGVNQCIKIGWSNRNSRTIDINNSCNFRIAIQICGFNSGGNVDCREDNWPILTTANPGKTEVGARDIPRGSPLKFGACRGVVGGATTGVSGDNFTKWKFVPQQQTVVFNCRY